MCGITGAARLSRTSEPAIARERLEAMTEIVRHRGPNDVGTFFDDGVALGVRRLSIVDVEGGHQPFSNEERRRLGAIQNGELYNHAELRRGLEARAIALRSALRHRDPPAPLRGVRRATSPTQLRGMFGFAVWDGARRRR